MDTEQYLSMFIEESMENLQTLNECLLELEQNSDDLDKVNEIFRVAHTIKGMAATMGYSTIAELTHKMEDVLSKFRDGKLKVSVDVISTLFQCLDTLESMTNNVAEGVDEEVDITDIIAKLEKIGAVSGKVERQETIKPKEAQDIKEKETATDLSSEDLKIELDEYEKDVVMEAIEKEFNPFEIYVTISEQALLKSARAYIIFKTLEEHGEIIKSVPLVDEIENEDFETDIALVFVTESKQDEIEKLIASISEIDKVVVKPIDLKVEKKKNSETVTKVDKKINEIKNDKNEKSEKGEKTKKVHQSVRVDLDRLDKFMNMVSELVIYRTRLEQLSTSHKLQDLDETLEQVGRTTSDLQDLVMKIRMLPLDMVFNRFPRMVRDLALELNKEINFVIEGADTELDRTVIDEIGEPLIHLIRNSVDHGIEHRDERVKKGKNPIGTIKLSAYQEGTKAVIKVQDDGGGLNVAKIKEKANKIGINTTDMSESDIKHLIFKEGFSTNDKVTDVSGRGVGMDAVQAKVSSLGGTVELQSETDKGSTFIINLPLTLQIIQALLVKVGTETMAISLGCVDRVIEFTEDMIKKSNNREVILHMGNVIPLTRLNKKLKIETCKQDKKFIIIVNVGNKTSAIVVDSLLGQQEIVIKPLGKTLQNVKEYIGATILGDGLVTLILDIGGLI
jgi:two-component system chemotaxis sensor kinase CheA